MKPRFVRRSLSAFAAAFTVLAAARATVSAEPLRAWLTTPDQHALLAPVTSPSAPAPSAATATATVIRVDPSRRFQTIDGFGFALTGGSAQHLIAMAPAVRHALLTELFSPGGQGIGISYLRVSIGSSDLNQRVFSYDDLPVGESDPKLQNFSLAEDRFDVVPVLKEILAINPGIRILGSPWSAPTWMKTNGNIQGGMLRQDCYGVYAEYFARYIEAMAREGIRIDAITPQNEPFNDGNTPSMQFFAKDEAAFIRDHLGPTLRRHGLTTKIVIYDHNCDAPEYPISVLSDPAAAAFIDGSGFHLYAGPIEALSTVHDRFPDKNLYFTEMMAVNRKEFAIAPPVARILIGATRNWSRNVILWNLAADSQFQPHTNNGGCPFCQGAVTIDGDRVERNLAYYVIGHASKFVPAGSARIDSTTSASLPNVAFRTPSGETVLIVANLGTADAAFNVESGNTRMPFTLPAGAVATLVW